MMMCPQGESRPTDADKGKQRTAGGRQLVPVVLLCLILVISSGLAASPSTNSPAPFSFSTLRDQARALATKDYKPVDQPAAPDFIKNLTYDQYQQIQFKPDQAPWRDAHLRFDLQFFHRGFLFNEPVRIHLLDNGQPHDLPFSPAEFNYGSDHFPQPVPPDLGFAGFKVVYAAVPDQLQKLTEIASFLGASYFRLVGLHQHYGGAFRGLAIDTGEPAGEEFPRFTEFWIERPGAAAEFLQCYALLDCPTCTGAYRFVLKPGDNTIAEMEASLFVRKTGKKLGFAPLTSMFLFGKNRTRFIPDFRPEVHDSDGLLIQSSDGNWTWRPLVNPVKTHHMQRFPVAGLSGFGLLQRERDFLCYEDLAARYDLRPTLWVKTEGDWGPGSVELVEIPSPNEYNDNIVAYWLPQKPLQPNQEFHWTCQLSAMAQGPDEGVLARVMATRLTPAHEKTPVRFVLDFTADCAPALPPQSSPEAKADTSHGKIANLALQRNEVTGGWRVAFDLTDVGSDVAELRVLLHTAGKPLSETWVYRYEPE